MQSRDRPRGGCVDFEWTADHASPPRRRGVCRAAAGRRGGPPRPRGRLLPRVLAGLRPLRAAGPDRPAEWGGAGHDLLSAVAVLEGIGCGARDNGLVFSVAAHAASCGGPVPFGTDAQKREWLPGLTDGSAIGAAAITEPGSGSSALALAATAVPDGDGWILDGSKTFVTNAPVADVFVLYARTAPGFAGITCFWCRATPPGYVVGAPIEKMGLRTSPMAQVYLEGCRRRQRAAGRRRLGSARLQPGMDVERLLVMAPAVGVMERLVERCAAHAGSARSAVWRSACTSRWHTGSRTWSSRWSRPGSCSTGPPGRRCPPRHRDARIGPRQARCQRGLRGSVPQRDADLRRVRIHGRVRDRAGTA